MSDASNCSAHLFDFACGSRQPIPHGHWELVTRIFTMGVEKRYRFRHAPNTHVKFGNYANHERLSSGLSAYYEAARTAQGRL